MIDVAVGVIRKGNQVLIAKRPQHLHCGGLWEFPGGKIEPGESPELALQRELQEEIGINIQKAQALTEIVHDYAEKSVKLYVFQVEHFHGEPRGQEGQTIEWIDISLLSNKHFPAANQAIISLLSQ